MSKHYNLVRMTVCFIGLAFAFSAFGSIPPVSPLRSTFIRTVSVTGTIAPKKRTFINSPFNGYVQRVYVKPGSTVSAGDPIIAVTQGPKASDDEIFPIRSPFSGVVVQVSRSQGEYVEAGGGQAGGLVRIDDNSKFFLEAKVGEFDVQRVKLNQSVKLRLPSVPNREFQGKVVEVALASLVSKDGETGRAEFPVKIELQNVDASIRSGLTAIGEIVIEKRENALLVPQEFVARKGKSFFVRLSSGKTQEIFVKDQNEDYFEIAKGVSEGDLLAPIDFSKPIKTNLGE